jgi:hypothetical protein
LKSLMNFAAAERRRTKFFSVFCPLTPVAAFFASSSPHPALFSERHVSPPFQFRPRTGPFRRFC